MWEKGQAMWKEYRDILRVCRDVMRKDKDHLELSLTKDVMDNKKCFFRYISSKRSNREYVGLLLNGVGALMMKDTEKTVILNAFFCFSFHW